MKILITSILLIAAFTGCTSVALRRYAVNQAATVSDVRYQEVLDNLARLADNAGNPVSFAIVDNGAANLSDTLSGETNTIWDHAVHGFSKETLTAFARRNPDLSWNLTPVASEPQLAGIRVACLWALYGPPPADSDYMSLLRSPMYGEYSGYHLGVAYQMSRIIPGWLHVGQKKDMPKSPCYSAHHNCTYVWVGADGLPGLSEFSLVVLDIATLDPSSLALAEPYASVDIKLIPSTPGSNLTSADIPINQDTITQSLQARQTYAVVNGQIKPGAISIQTPGSPAEGLQMVWGNVEPVTGPNASNVSRLPMVRQ